MRKIVVIVLSFIIVSSLLITGCSNSEDSTTTEDANITFVQDYSSQWNENQVVVLNGIGLYLPKGWEYNRDSDGITIIPSEDMPAVFRLSITKGSSVDLSDNKVQKQAVDYIVRSFRSGTVEECEVLDSSLDTVKSPNGKKTRQQLNIKMREKAKQGEAVAYASLFYIGDLQCILGLVQFPAAGFDFSYDFYCIGESVWNVDDAFLSPEDYESSIDSTKENITSTEENKEDLDYVSEDQSEGVISDKETKVMYDQFIEELKSGGVVYDIDDSMDADGVWIFYVDESWSSLSQSQKQTLADYILSNIKPWSEGMFGLTPTLVIRNQTGGTVAETNWNSTKMNVN